MPSGSASKRARSTAPASTGDNPELLAPNPEEEPAPAGPPDDGLFTFESTEGPIRLLPTSKIPRNFAMMEAAAEGSYEVLSVLMLKAAIVDIPPDKPGTGLGRMRKLGGVETSSVYSQWSAQSRVTVGNSDAS